MMNQKKAVLIILFLSIINLVEGQTTYENKDYRFKVKIPKTWKIYGEIKNDTTNNYSIVDWDLPKIYSEMENAMIENQISVTAYKRADFKNVFQLINFELKKKEKQIRNKILVDSIPLRTYIIHSNVRGLDYKSKMYFIYINGIGYVINFTATPGTFNKNIKVFEKFFSTLNFI